MTTPLIDRLASKYTVTQSGCWLWKGGHNGRYGLIWDNDVKKPVYAHRASYRVHKGEIAPGLVIDHLCRTPLCVNPAHLEAVTARENNMRSDSPSALAARRTHCPHNHPWDEANTHIYRGYRKCRACDRIAHRKGAATEAIDKVLYEQSVNMPAERVDT